MKGGESRHSQGSHPDILLLTLEISDDLLEPPGLKQLWHYWQEARDSVGGRLPSRQDFDVVDLRECLGNLNLLDVLDGGRDFCYRVYGTNIALAHDEDLTHKRTSELAPETARVIGRLYRRVYREKQPIFCRRRGRANAPVQLWDCLLLPLATDGNNVDQIMSAGYPRAFLGDVQDDD